MSGMERSFLREIDTPALLVDLDLLERNIARMAAFGREAGVNIRPHCKTHKSPQLAARQMEAGAIGITCQKLGEAVVMAAAGIGGLLVASPVVGPQKIRRLTELAHKFLGFWVINPNYPDIIAKDLRTFPQRRGFVGFKFWSDYHLVPVTSPKYAAALEYANEHALLIMIHIWGESPFDAPALVGQIAERCAQFFMAHCGHGDWETSVSVARDLPNVYLDLTSVPNAHDFSLMSGGSPSTCTGLSRACRKPLSPPCALAGCGCW